MNKNYMEPEIVPTNLRVFEFVTLDLKIRLDFGLIRRSQRAKMAILTLKMLGII